MSITILSNNHVQELLKNGSNFLIESPLSGLCITEKECIVFCNERLAQILGSSGDELLGMNIHKLFYKVNCRKIENVQNKKTNVSFSSTLNMVGLRKDGRVVYTQQSVYEYTFEGRRLTAWQVMDVTRHGTDQKNMYQSEQRDRLISNKVLQSQEQERKRVASDLHDSIGQTLSSIKFGLENKLRKHSTCLPDEIQYQLTDSVAEIQNAVEEVRRISMDLHPFILDDLGLEAALSWLLRQFQSKQPSIRLYRDLNIQQNKIDNALSVVIFRIIQEALNNIAKHANATQVSVSLISGRTGVTMSVSDNGCGFPVEQMGVNSSGYGLQSMKERARLYSGQLQIDSTIGEGTRLQVTWARRTEPDEKSVKDDSKQSESDAQICAKIQKSLADGSQPLQSEHVIKRPQTSMFPA